MSLSDISVPKYLKIKVVNMGYGTCYLYNLTSRNTIKVKLNRF